MANEYWKSRAAADEAKAQKIAKSYMKKEKKLYKEALEVIDGKIDRLYTKINWGGEDTVTRSELWQYQYYLDLRDSIEKEVGAIGSKQISLTEQVINEVYEKTLNTEITTANKITNFNSGNVKKVINSQWSGKNFSERIWENTNNLSETLKRNITDLIVMGRNPEEIKAELRSEFGVSYRCADRLVRTEASYAYNTAAADRYKEAGVNKVEILVEDDACEDCLELIGQEFEIHSVPRLPIHPNCRCCLVPIIEKIF